MKKILSFVLALVMVASMAVMAFAEGEATTPVTGTVYDAADFATNAKIVETPADLKGKFGFTELAVKITTAENHPDLFSMPGLKAGDTVSIYYYVETANCEAYGWYNGNQFGASMNMKAGFHVDEFVLNADTNSIGLHMKNGDTVEMYISQIVVRQGAVKSVDWQKELADNPTSYTFTAEQIAATYDATSGTPTCQPGYPASSQATYVDTPEEYIAAAGEKSIHVVNGSIFMNNAHFSFLTGYTYTVVIEGAIVSAPTSGAQEFCFNGNTNNFPGSTWDASAGTVTIKYVATASTWNFSLYSCNGAEAYIKKVTIYEVPDPVRDPATSEETFSPAELFASGSAATLTKDGLLCSATFLQNTYAQWTTALAPYGTVAGKELVIEYEVLNGDMTGLHLNGLGAFFISMPGEKGDHTFVTDAVPDYGLFNFHNNGIKQDMVIKSVTIRNKGGNPVVATWTPADALATKNATYETIEVGYNFDAAKVYMVSVNYRAYVGAAAPTVTIGAKTMTLKAGDNVAKVAVIGGANKIVINAPAATVLVGDITYEEVGEEYAEFMTEVNTHVNSVKMDKTLAQTPAAAAEYVTDLLQKSGKYIVKSIDYVEGSFVPYADDATVAAASAATNGSISFVVEFEETAARGFTYTDEFTVEIVAKTGISDYNAATGDSAIVAIVALIAVISLAGVVIAKKKVASK